MVDIQLSYRLYLSSPNRSRSNQDTRAGPIYTSSSPDDDESTVYIVQHYRVSVSGGLSTSLNITHYSFLPFDSNTFNNFKSRYDSFNGFDFQFEDHSTPWVVESPGLWLHLKTEPRRPI